MGKESILILLLLSATLPLRTAADEVAGQSTEHDDHSYVAKNVTIVLLGVILILTLVFEASRNVVQSSRALMITDDRSSPVRQ